MRAKLRTILNTLTSNVSWQREMKLKYGGNYVAKNYHRIGHGNPCSGAPKQEWMKFMEAEFDRLDKNKSGELDAKELAQSKLQVSPFAKVGK
jgi:hypothetical protein